MRIDVEKLGRLTWSWRHGIAAEAEAQADALTGVALLEAMERVVAATDDPERVRALRGGARRVRDGARRAIADAQDLGRVEAAAARWRE